MSKREPKQDIAILNGFYYGSSDSCFYRILEEFIIDEASVILDKKWCWPKTTSKLSNPELFIGTV